MRHPDPRSAKAIWQRAFANSLAALAVVVLLAGMAPLIGDIAPYRPVAALLVVAGLAGSPLILNALRTRNLKQWLREPLSWAGVVGVSLYSREEIDAQ